MCVCVCVYVHVRVHTCMGVCVCVCVRNWTYESLDRFGWLMVSEHLVKHIYQMCVLVCVCSCGV